MDYIEIIWQKQEKNIDNWSSTSIILKDIQSRVDDYTHELDYFFKIDTQEKVTAIMKYIYTNNVYLNPGEDQFTFERPYVYVIDILRHEEDKATHNTT